MSSTKKADKLWQDFSGLANNPYVFANQRLIEPAPVDEIKRLPHEEDIIREQRRTFFEHDEAMQHIFAGDFEAYHSALDNPDLLIERMEERMHELEHAIELGTEAGLGDVPWWQDEFWGDDEDDLESLEAADEAWAGEMEDDWQSDVLYQKANKWAHRLFSVGSKIYEDKKRSDSDLYRVLVNIFLVPSKIVYASSVADNFMPLDSEDECEEIENELSLHGYTLCLAFLQRTRESLVNLINKRLPPLNEWRAALLAADEIALELQGRMIALAKQLRKR